MYLVTVLFNNRMTHRYLIEGADQDKAINTLDRHIENDGAGLEIVASTIIQMGPIWLLDTSVEVYFDDLQDLEPPTQPNQGGETNRKDNRV